MNEKEYIERRSVYNDMLNAMSCTGYQSRALDVINSQPAADVSAVKCGQWIREDRAVTCTNCGRSYDTDFEVKANITLSFRHCPNCGADMTRAASQSKAAERPIKLAPCHCCGEEHFLSVKSKTKVMKHYTKPMYTYQVRCNNCFARGSVKYTEAEAISAWNGVER